MDETSQAVETENQKVEREKRREEIQSQFHLETILKELAMINGDMDEDEDEDDDEDDNMVNREMKDSTTETEKPEPIESIREKYANSRQSVKREETVEELLGVSPVDLRSEVVGKIGIPEIGINEKGDRLEIKEAEERGVKRVELDWSCHVDCQKSHRKRCRR